VVLKVSCEHSLDSDGFYVYWTDVVATNIMRYDINYKTGLVYLIYAIDENIMRYDIHYNTGLVYWT
jgi:hypothetical protein